MCAGSGTAFAQAGSAGGTVGQKDKSVSGTNNPAPAATTSGKSGSAGGAAGAATKESASSTSDPCHVVGSWTYHTPLGTYEVVFDAQGSAVSTSGQTAQWSCSAGNVTANWPTGFTDHLSVTADGKKFFGHTAMGLAISGDRH
jgi:hypothetical protein